MLFSRDCCDPWPLSEPAPAGLPAVAGCLLLPGLSALRRAPVLFSRGMAAPLPGADPRCLEWRGAIGIRPKGRDVIAAHPSRPSAGVKRAVFSSCALCVARVLATLCAFSRESEPPRWGKRPPGPFPSVGASTGSRRAHVASRQVSRKWRGRHTEAPPAGSRRGARRETGTPRRGSTGGVAFLQRALPPGWRREPWRQLEPRIA